MNDVFPQDYIFKICEERGHFGNAIKSFCKVAKDNERTSHYQDFSLPNKYFIVNLLVLLSYTIVEPQSMKLEC